jgi:DNA-binding LacI/PurR family transcriptional regulator
MPDPIRPPVKTRPTMADVARAAGVSVTTVSYVLGGRSGNHDASRISEDTRKRVAGAVAAIGYRINEPARNLRRNRTDRVLLLMDRLSSPYDQLLASEVDASLAPSGRALSIMVCTSLERMEVALGTVRQGHADGAIVQGRLTTGWQEMLERYAAEGVPMVAISSVLEPRGFDVVMNDDARGIRTAVDHLLARGHRRFGFLAHSVEPGLPDNRMEIVRERLAESGLDLPDEMVMPGARDRNVAFASVRALLDRPHPPTALVSASDTGGIAALWAAQSLNLRIPEDIAIVGCGNVEECLITVPQLSSAGPHAPDFAPIAQMLIDRLDKSGPTEDRRLLIPWEFFARASAG